MGSITFKTKKYSHHPVLKNPNQHPKSAFLCSWNLLVNAELGEHQTEKETQVSEWKDRFPFYSSNMAEIRLRNESQLWLPVNKNLFPTAVWKGYHRGFYCRTHAQFWCISLHENLSFSIFCNHLTAGKLNLLGIAFPLLPVDKAFPKVSPTTFVAECTQKETQLQFQFYCVDTFLWQTRTFCNPKQPQLSHPVGLCCFSSKECMIDLHFSSHKYSQEADQHDLTQLTVVQ